jgi:aconitase B
MARVYNKMRDLEKAIQAQEKAMDTFSRLEKYADTDYLAQIVMTLSEFQDKAEMTDQAL